MRTMFTFFISRNDNTYGTLGIKQSDKYELFLIYLLSDPNVLEEKSVIQEALRIMKQFSITI